MASPAELAAMKAAQAKAVCDGHFDATVTIDNRAPTVQSMIDKVEAKLSGGEAVETTTHERNAEIHRAYSVTTDSKGGTVAKELKGSTTINKPGEAQRKPFHPLPHSGCMI
jgi:hypothetical protein